MRAKNLQIGPLRLYRGDAFKIKQFEFNKTNKYCLLGQGVYLTDKIDVADTYRTKGDLNVSKRFDVSVTCGNKNDAKEMGVAKYLDHKRWQLTPCVKTLNPSQEKEFKQEYLSKLYEESVIITRRLESTRSTKENRLWVFDIEELVPKNGWVSVFEFPEPYFTVNTINFDARTHDKGFLELLDNVNFWRDKGRTIKSTTSTLTGYLGYRLDRDRGRNVQLVPNELNFARIIPALKEFGIHGFEYNGGARLGGNLFHRAFNIFDVSYVNDHKVDRYR